MNSKMTTNSQLSTTESKQNQKQTKQTTRTGRESQKWRSHGGLLEGRRRKRLRGRMRRKGKGNKKHNCALADVAQWNEWCGSVE